MPARPRRPGIRRAGRSGGGASSGSGCGGSVGLPRAAQRLAVQPRASACPAEPHTLSAPRIPIGWQASHPTLSPRWCSICIRGHPRSRAPVASPGPTR